MTRLRRSRMRPAMAAFCALCLAGPASADVWVSPIPWFPFTRIQWQKHTLGSDRGVWLETAASALAWRIVFESRWRTDFREKSGVLEVEASDRCEEVELYVEKTGSRAGKPAFRRVSDRTMHVDVRSRAEPGEFTSRWRAFVSRGPLRKPPQLAPFDPASCETIRDRCVDKEPETQIHWRIIAATKGIGQRWGPRWSFTCSEADGAVDRCLDYVEAEEARSTDALVRYEQRMICSGVVMVTGAPDRPSIALEVVSASNDTQWGHTEFGTDDRIGISAWAFAPATLVADVVFMALVTVVHAPIYLISPGSAFKH